MVGSMIRFYTAWDILSICCGWFVDLVGR